MSRGTAVEMPARDRLRHRAGTAGRAGGAGERAQCGRDADADGRHLGRARAPADGCVGNGLFRHYPGGSATGRERRGGGSRSDRGAGGGARFPVGCGRRVRGRSRPGAAGAGGGVGGDGLSSRLRCRGYQRGYERPRRGERVRGVLAPDGGGEPRAPRRAGRDGELCGVAAPGRRCAARAAPLQERDPARRNLPGAGDVARAGASLAVGAAEGGRAV